MKIRTVIQNKILWLDVFYVSRAEDIPWQLTAKLQDKSEILLQKRVLPSGRFYMVEQCKGVIRGGPYGPVQQ